MMRKRDDLTDRIQERCIAQMQRLGQNPRQVWLAMGGDKSPTSYNHVNDYLTRRSSIGSHKLQHLLSVLNLRIVAQK